MKSPLKRICVFCGSSPGLGSDYRAIAGRLPPFLVMEILERAQALERAGHDVIHIEIGEPDFATPKKIAEAGIEAIRRGETHYTHSLGILPQRRL